MQPEDDCEDLPDSGVIRVDDPDERSRWAKAFNVTDAVLVQAVALVGNSIAELRKLFPEDERTPRR